MPDRLKPGQPPLRVSELARLSGYSVWFIRKLFISGSLAYVSWAGTKERRIPVDAAAGLLKDLHVI